MKNQKLTSNLPKFTYSITDIKYSISNWAKYYSPNGNDDYDFIYFSSECSGKCTIKGSDIYREYYYKEIANITVSFEVICL